MSFTYTTTDKGIIDFQVDNTHMYCNVESKVITVNGTNYTLKILDNLLRELYRSTFRNNVIK